MSNSGTISNEVMNLVKEVWSSHDLNLDIPIIDIQHAWLAKLIFDLQLTSKEKKPTLDVFRYGVKEAARYTYIHFTVEEELLAMMNFPLIEEHKKMHREFVKYLREQIPFDRPPSVKDIHDLTDYLKDWLFNHILRHDAKYRDAILRDRISLPQFSEAVNEITDTRVLPEHKEFYLQMVEKEKLDDSTEDDIVKTVCEIWERYKLTVYIPIVDMQHMWLVKLVVELDKTIRINESERVRQFNKTVSNALEYIREHFATEEMMMVHYNYPGYAAHLRQHKYFIDFVIRRNEEFKEGDPMAAANLVSDLRDWLLTHIAVEDKRLRTFFKYRMGEVLNFTKSLIHSGKLVLRKGQVNLYQRVLEERQKTSDSTL